LKNESMMIELGPDHLISN